MTRGSARGMTSLAVGSGALLGLFSRGCSSTRITDDRRILYVRAPPLARSKISPCEIAGKQAEQTQHDWDARYHEEVENEDRGQRSIETLEPARR